MSPLLSADDWDVVYCDAAIVDLSDRQIEDADVLVVLGGPIGVYDADSYPFLAQEIGILERRLASDRPTLGICLGSQLMARALGARVYPGDVKEIGWGAVQLTDAGRASCVGGALPCEVVVIANSRSQSQPLTDLHFAAARHIHQHNARAEPVNAVRVARRRTVQNVLSADV